MDKYTGDFAVFDGHVDLVYMMMQRFENVSFDELTSGTITSLKLKAGNVRVIVLAFYCQDRFNGQDKSTSHLNHLLKYANKHLKSLFHIKTEQDLNRVYYGRMNTGALYLLENADALIDIDLTEFMQKGFAVVGLTHAGRNRIADGNGVKYPQGITSAGQRLIKRLESQNIVIDTAHLAEPGFWELLELFDGHLISSHTGFHRFCDLPRNLSDDQVKTLIERDAIIGVTVNPEMLSVNQKATIYDLYCQTDWLVQKYGDKNVGIGSDFGGFEIENDGLNHPGMFKRLSEIFLEHGYSKEAVKNIMGENWRSFYEKYMLLSSNQR